MSPMRCVIVGDPQAPLATFFAVLDHHGLRDAASGRVRAGVRLVCVGDYFDWGTAADAPRAAKEGLELLRWLAGHPEDQVVLVAGNHDLARIGELVSFDDATFARARADAVGVWSDDAAAEAAFRARWPMLPSSEIARRDFNAFSAAQKKLVTKLLGARRMHLAWAPEGRDDLLVCHAGVTRSALERVGIAADAGAHAIAAGLDERLAMAFDGWSGHDPFVIPDLHWPGGPASGGLEGDGILFHRPAAKAGRRRYDPRDLPAGLTQVIGHVRDKKCRELLAGWTVPGEAAADGPLRHLRVDADGRVQYARGVAEGARLIFVDGGMNYTSPDRYEVLSL